MTAERGDRADKDKWIMYIETPSSESGADVNAHIFAENDASLDSAERVAEEVIGGKIIKRDPDRKTKSFTTGFDNRHPRLGSIWEPTGDAWKRRKKDEKIN